MLEFLLAKGFHIGSSALAYAAKHHNAPMAKVRGGHCSQQPAQQPWQRSIHVTFCMQQRIGEAVMKNLHCASHLKCNHIYYTHAGAA